jgi:hypothetical protein
VVQEDVPFEVPTVDREDGVSRTLREAVRELDTVLYSRLKKDKTDSRALAVIEDTIVKIKELDNLEDEIHKIPA